MLSKILGKLLKQYFKVISKILTEVQKQFFKTRLYLEKLSYLNDKNPSLDKVRLSDNKPLTDDEFAKIEKICDIFSSLSESQTKNVAPPDGGLFWHVADKTTWCFDLHTRKNRSEIEHSFLFNNRFRDFATIAYDVDAMTPHPDFWIRRYIRLQNAIPKKWRVKMPARFGEIGWKVNGFPVNRLTSINQERLSAFYLSGVIPYLENQFYPRIMEIGAGGGELGYTLCKALPSCTWYDCDLLGSLFQSAIHLLVMLPKKKHLIYVGDLPLSATVDEKYIIRSAAEASRLTDAVVSIPNFLIQDFVGHLQLHFAYNTYSFAEMPRVAVEEYADVLGSFLKNEGVLFDQNGYFPEECGHNVVDILAQHFQHQSWSANYPDIEQAYVKYILNGAIRVWSNNSVTNNLHVGMRSFRTDRIVESMLNHDDVVDIKFSHEMWGRIREIFPECV
jgi:hypothetical protein